MFNMVQRWTEGSYWHGKIHFAGCIRGPQGQSIVEYVWLTRDTWYCNCDVMRKLPCHFSRPSAETYALYWKTIILLVHWAGKKLMNFSSIIKYHSFNDLLLCNMAKNHLCPVTSLSGNDPTAWNIKEMHCNLLSSVRRINDHNDYLHMSTCPKPVTSNHWFDHGFDHARL